MPDDLGWKGLSQVCYTCLNTLGLILDSTGFAKPKVHADAGSTPASSTK